MSLEFFKKHLNTILMIVIVLMGVEILYLAWQNQQLTAMIRDPKQVFKTLDSGDRVPSLVAEDLDGNEVNLRYGDGEPHTLLFWFSPSCESCEANLDFWNVLYSDNQKGTVRFLGFCACSPDEAYGIVEEEALGFPVVCALDPFIVDSYKGNVLPQTVLIAPDGTIRKVWPGSLLEGQREEIVSALESLN